MTGAINDNITLLKYSLAPSQRGPFSSNNARNLSLLMVGTFDGCLDTYVFLEIGAFGVTGFFIHSKNKQNFSDKAFFTAAYFVPE